MRTVLRGSATRRALDVTSKSCATQQRCSTRTEAHLATRRAIVQSRAFGSFPRPVVSVCFEGVRAVRHGVPQTVGTRKSHCPTLDWQPGQRGVYTRWHNGFAFGLGWQAMSPVLNTRPAMSKLLAPLSSCPSCASTAGNNTSRHLAKPPLLVCSTTTQ
jgi:hypothetical protein